MKVSEIPKNDLYVAILDDDADNPSGSIRSDWVKSFSEDYGQPLLENILLTRDPIKFIKFADSHAAAALFCDPGALGNTGYQAVKYKEDQIIRRWLENNTSRVLNIPWLLPIENYGDITTFELKHNCNFFGMEFQWEVNQILYEQLFKCNPLALFIDEFAMDCAHVQYIKKLKEPVLSAVCKQLGIGGHRIADRKKAINDYYSDVWKAQMKRRGVKL